MPSDDRTQQALDALAVPRAAFRAALAATVAEVQAYAAAQCIGDNGQIERLSAELGVFGASRIDVQRAAALFADRLSLDAHAIDTVASALRTLQELAAREDDLFVVDVPLGSTLRNVVAQALEEIGRAFGASRVAELARTDRYRPADHARSLGSFPPHRWSRAERRMAPPLVVQVDGRDLQAPSLAEFLDGTLKLVLVVRGESAPAPLVRLIAPDTFVLQTTDPGALAPFAAWDGPGVAALVPDSAAQFVHDPAGGSALWERLKIVADPRDARLRALGGISRAQQAAELEQLRLLARAPTVAPPTGTAAGGPTPVPQAPDPAGKLAAWLLSQAVLPEPE